MCQYPIKFGDHNTACRKCDECLNARINGWAVRAMAERAFAGQMVALTLTYADLPSGRPDGANVFKYKDIADFMKRLREAYFAKYKQRGGIRYIVCGERGSRGTRRVHWHILIFTDQPLGCLGKFSTYSGRPVEEPDLETNYEWSIWGHGNVRLQEPTGKGVYYALKYACKDQYSTAKSVGQNRETKSHSYAASMFRMSKQPPIGFPYLEKWLDDHEAKNACPPSLDVRVPDYSGYWYLTGNFREYALLRIRASNLAFREKYGKDFAQYASLRASLSKTNQNENLPNNDLETLDYGKTEINWSEEGVNATNVDLSSFTAGLDRSRVARRTQAIIKRCGSVTPCLECEVQWTSEQIQELQGKEEYYKHRFSQANPDIPDNQFEKRFSQFWASLLKPSRGCKRRNDDEVFYAFQAAKSIRDLGKRIGGPTDDESGRNAASKKPRPEK